MARGAAEAARPQGAAAMCNGRYACRPGDQRGVRLHHRAPDPLLARAHCSASARCLECFGVRCSGFCGGLWRLLRKLDSIRIHHSTPRHTQTVKETASRPHDGWRCNRYKLVEWEFEPAEEQNCVWLPCHSFWCALMALLLHVSKTQQITMNCINGRLSITDL